MTLAARGRRLCGKTSWVGQHSGLKVIPETGTGSNKPAEIGIVTQDYNPGGG